MEQLVSRFGPLARQEGLIALALTVLCAGLLWAACLGHGAGISPDSVYYLDAARHIASGDGVVTTLPEGTPRPMVTWPPLYPAALAAGAAAGAAPQDWVPWLHGALYVVMALGAYLVLRWAGVTPGVAGCAAAIAVFAGSMLRAFHLALSEALFLPLWLGLMALLARALVDHRRFWLVAAGLCAAAATLTRYVAQGAIPAAALLLAVMPATMAWRARLGRAGLFFACAQLPVLLWLLRNWLASDSVAERDFALQAVHFGWFFDLWRVATTWFVPEQVNRWPRHVLSVFIFGLIAAGLAGASKIPQVAPWRALAASCAVCAAGYLALMFGAEFGSSRAQDLDQRMLLPVLAPLAILTGLAGSGHARVHRVLAGVVCLLALGCMVRSALTAAHLHGQGAGYGAPAWQKALGGELPPGTLASNHPEALAWAQQRPCLRLPPLGPDGRSLDASRKTEFLRGIGDSGATVVLFDERRAWDAPPEVLIPELGLREVGRDGVRVVYLLPGR